MNENTTGTPAEALTDSPVKSHKETHPNAIEDVDLAFDVAEGTKGD